MAATSRLDLRGGVCPLCGTSDVIVTTPTYERGEYQRTTPLPAVRNSDTRFDMYLCRPCGYTQWFMPGSSSHDWDDCKDHWREVAPRVPGAPYR